MSTVLILDLKKCPDKTLTKLPKEKLVKIFEDFSWILSQENPFRIYKKKFLNFKRISLSLYHLFKKKYDSKKLLEELVNKYYLTILKFSLGIIFSISFFGAGKSILLKRKIAPRSIIKTEINFKIRLIALLLELVFLINCI